MTTTERLYEADAYLRSCDATVSACVDNALVLDRTVFYAMGGGQPGDRGTLTLDDGRVLTVADTRKGEAGAVLHVVDEADAEGLNTLVGAHLVAEIDWDLRHRHMRMHTCLHLLGALVDAPVTGGNLTAEKGRLDFDLPEATVQKEPLTEALNELIRQDIPTTLSWITDEELAAQPELVRTMSVKPPSGAGRVRLLAIKGTDLQACGGTHVARTGEIGAVRVAKIEKKSRLNRRIQVVFD